MHRFNEQSEIFIENNNIQVLSYRNLHLKMDSNHFLERLR